MNEIPYSKELVIREENDEEFRKESVERLDKSFEGEDVPTVVSFENPEKIRELLTGKRLELMRTIMTDKPESITELAQQTDRDIKDVHTDLELLEDKKIVFFKKNGRKKQPIIPYSDIKVDYSLKNTLTKDKGVEA